MDRIFTPGLICIKRVQAKTTQKDLSVSSSSSLLSSLAKAPS